MKTIEALKRLQAETKAEVYLVGGFVRDYARNRNNKDLDVVVRGLSMENIKNFLKGYGKLKEISLSKTNDTFTIDILLFEAAGDNVGAQITLPRKGKQQIPFMHNTLKQDAEYRDFKMNAMYLPINYTSRRDIIDFSGGLNDIANRKITANGSPTKRIKESPIRMLRALSLAARTMYTVSDELIDAMTEKSILIKKCPVEVIRVEFNEILMSRKPSRYFRLMRKVGLLKHIIPEVNACFGVKQDTKFHKYDILSHLLYTVDNCDYNLVIRLAGLLHDVGKVETRKEIGYGKNKKTTFYKHEVVSEKLAKNFLQRLKYDVETTKQVLLLVSNHMYHYTREWTDAAIRRFIKRVGLTKEYLTEENIANFPLFKLRTAERLGNGLKTIGVTDRQKDFEEKILRVYRESSALELRDLKINGNTIIETFKLKAGVQIGGILKFLLEKVMEKPELNNELELLKLTTEYLCQWSKSEQP